MKEQLMLTKAQFNIYEVEHYGVEEKTLGDLRKAGCTNILVLLRDHDRGLIRVACDLPEGITPRTNSNWSAPVYERTNTTASFATDRKRVLNDERSRKAKQFPQGKQALRLADRVGGCLRGEVSPS